MNGLALQIDGKWAVLDDDASVSIEGNSPVWGEGNSFSLPFELDVEANRHILGNADQITGQSVYEVLDGKSAVLYTLGIPVCYGRIKMEDEVEISDGKMDVTLVSGNLTFEEMIDGMNCQDVELLDRIVVGERVSEFTIEITKNTDSSIKASASSYFPSRFMWMNVDGKSTANCSESYPQAKYCNTRICYAMPEENAEGEDLGLETIYHGTTPVDLTIPLRKVCDPEKYARNVVLDYDRSLSGLCFYVLYFLDCLFGKIGCSINHDRISYMEDMKRLAFCNSRCGYDEEDAGINVDPEEYIRVKMNEEVIFSYNLLSGKYTPKWEIPLKYCVANSKNFPDVGVSEIIEGLKSGFGVRFLFDWKSNSVNCVFVRDILKDEEVISIPSASVYEYVKVDNHIKGFRLGYSESDDENSFFNYSEWDAPTRIMGSFNEIIAHVTAETKDLFIDPRIGNSYRVFIDEEATTTEEANPSLMEVGAFNSAEFGDCSDDECIEHVEIGFSPVIMNDVTYKRRRTALRSAKRTGSSSVLLELPDDSEPPIEDGGSQSPDGEGGSRPPIAGGGTAPSYDEVSNDQMFAWLLDVSMKYPSWRPFTRIAISTGERDIPEISYSYFDAQRFDETRPDQSKQAYIEKYKGRRNVATYVKANLYKNESPIQEYDAGFLLGIMRGPGNESGVEDFDENYDEEGNSRYVLTSVNSAFHSDTVDNYARAWDYNGREDGGIETEGSISLKLRAEKPNPEGGFYPITETYAQKRGLFDKFYTEYAYFVVNRKIVKMTCRMEMADVLNIDWTKRYKIGEYIGFINKYSYTISSEGMSDVELEMYYI